MCRFKKGWHSKLLCFAVNCVELVYGRVGLGCADSGRSAIR